MANGSRQRFRLKRRSGPGGKSIPWLQERLFGFLWWRWWEPVHYNERSMKAEAVECYKRLTELVPLIEESKKDVERAHKEIDTHHTDKGISKSFWASARPRRGDIPDCEEEYKEVKRAFDGQGRRRPTGGTRSAYFPEGLSHLSGVIVDGQSYDHAIPYRKPSGQQQQGQGNQKKKHRGGGNPPPNNQGQ